MKNQGLKIETHVALHVQQDDRSEAVGPSISFYKCVTDRIESQGHLHGIHLNPGTDADFIVMQVIRNHRDSFFSVSL